MAKHNHFILRNDYNEKLPVAIEPEGTFVILNNREDLTVFEQYNDEPLTLYVSTNKEGLPTIAIWPGDGTIRVEKNGVNVLE